MWIFLNDSFLSIVSHRDQPDMLLVRARHPGDIEAVFYGAQVTHTPGNDYHYRVVLPRSEVGRVLAARVEGIDYGNFKNSVRDDERHTFYFRAYNAMLSFGQQVRRATQRRLGFQEPIPF